jgi:hypothetical protein
MPERLVEFDFNRHDGVLVDLQLAGFGRERPEFGLVVDLYPATDPHSRRRRYPWVGHDPARFLVKGDIPKLVGRATSGNIERMRTDLTKHTEAVVLLFAATSKPKPSP